MSLRSSTLPIFWLFAGTYVVASVSNIITKGDLSLKNTVVLHDGTVLQGGENEDLDVEYFKGVRYAEPPLGELRWAPPVLYTYNTTIGGVREEEDSNVVDATAFGAHCIQDLWPDGSEDCLFLNIFVKGRANDGNLKPVLVFIHGGSYTTGSSKFYTGENLVDYVDGNAIVVTIEYRLNIFGFLGAEELRTLDKASGSTGNYGIQDQRMALFWVQRNIDSFGGDPTRVTIMGESAGGGSVSNHLTMRRSWEYFDGAIIESGSFGIWSAQTMSRAQCVFNELLEKTACVTIVCLQGKSAEELLALHLSTQDNNVYLSPYLPTVDGVEMTTHPWLALEEENGVADVTLLQGTNSDEGILFTALDGRKRVNMSELVNYWAETKAYTSAEIAKLTQLYVIDNKDTYPVSNYTGVTTTEWWALQRSTGDSMFSCSAKYVSQQLARKLVEGIRVHPVYFYHFSYHSWHSSYSVHGSELPYVLHWKLGQYMQSDVTNMLSTYWANFVLDVDHNPNTVSFPEAASAAAASSSSSSPSFIQKQKQPEWMPYDAQTDELLFISDISHTAMMRGLKSAECDTFHIPYIDAYVRSNFA